MVIETSDLIIFGACALSLLCLSHAYAYLAGRRAGINALGEALMRDAINSLEGRNHDSSGR